MSQSVTRSYQWTAAFTAFCNGALIDEISSMFSIPLETLKRRSSDERWHALKAELPLGVPDVVIKGSGEQKLALIQQQRDRALSVFQYFYAELERTAKALADGTLKVKKTTVLKGGKDADGNQLPPVTVTYDCEPTFADKLTLATYARTVADGAYRAVGDFAGQGKTSNDAGATPTTPAAPAITIILPAAIAMPREMRTLDPKAVDVQSVVTKAKTD